MGVELHFGEDLRVQPHFLAVQQGHLRADHPLFLQALDTPPAGRLRQAHAFGHLCAGQRSVFLQYLEDAAVVGIQLAVHDQFPKLFSANQTIYRHPERDES